MDPFLTTNRRDYGWPTPTPPTTVPRQPPLTTTPRDAYMSKPALCSCVCDGHGWNPMFRRYLCLLDKEHRLSDELFTLKTEMTTLANDVLDHPTDDHSSKMRSLYTVDYARHGFGLVEYKEFMAASDSLVGSPIPCASIGLNNGFRDPNSFRHTAIPRPTIDPTQPVSFAVTPATLSVYHELFPGRTEYQDTICKMGLASLHASQQYKEPMPSSRRRWGDPCL